MQLQHILDNVFYVPGPSNIGVVVGKDRQALLVDTGIGTRSGRRLLQILEDQGLQLAAIFNTHCHGDHIGGNAYLVEHTGATVYAPPYDAVVLERPIWGTMCMFGGADPISELSSPRFSAQACKVDQIVTEGEMCVAGVAVQAISLPGHTGSHTGYIVGGVFFTGDALAGEEELVNARLSYAYSVTRRLQSLEKLRQYPCAYHVLGHGRIQRDIASLIDRNIAQVLDVLDFIKRYLTQGCADIGAIFGAVCEHYEIEIRTIGQYFLLYPTLHACLSHLNNCGEISFRIRGNQLLWCPTDGRS